jgi:chemotaxis family two-component system response regulator Rcp1
LLDLNLPKKDRREVLAEFKGSPVLKSIPVVILRTPASETDIQGSYQDHENCYITKSVDREGFLKVVRRIDSFWSSVVSLPRKARL